MKTPHPTNHITERIFLYRWFGNRFRDYGGRACEVKALEIASALGAEKIANIGSPRVDRWPKAVTLDAQTNKDIDFNTIPLPFENETIELVVSEQVIEHLHNTTFFLGELFRIAKRGGHLLLSTENLISLPNIISMLCGKVPFSLQPCCGIFMGGWKQGLINPECGLQSNHPAYAGVRGHVRVLTTKQLKYLMQLSGFVLLDTYRYALGHYVLIHAVKP